MIKKLMIIIIAFALLSIFTSCSGGFDSDSDNAGNVEKSIFGPDTIK